VAVSQFQEINYKKKSYLTIALLILLFTQITLLWKKYSEFTPPNQINLEHLNQYPPALISLFDPTNLDTWTKLNSQDLNTLQNWLSIENIEVKLNKFDDHMLLTFNAPLGSKPSNLLNKVKLLPKLTLVTLGVKTIDNYREFKLKFIF